MLQNSKEAIWTVVMYIKGTLENDFCLICRISGVLTIC